MNYYNDGKFRRVQKSTAKNIFMQNKGVLYMCPCNIRPDNMFSPPVAMTNESFENQVTYFENYNCNCNETGRRVAFYVLCEED